MMNDEKLDLPALKKLCDAATPGPWRSGKETQSGVKWVGTNCDDPNTGTGYNFECWPADAEFIAAARQAMPLLLKEIEEARSLRSLAEARMETLEELGKVDRKQLKERDEAINGAIIELDRLKGIKDYLDHAEWSVAGDYALSLLKENATLKAEVKKHQDHFEVCQSAKLVTFSLEIQALRQELGARHTEIKKLQYTLDQGKNDVAQLAAMCNEIVKLRDLLRDAQYEIGDSYNPVWERIDAALGEK